MRLLFLIVLIVGGLYAFKYLRDSKPIEESAPVEYAKSLQEDVKKADKAAQKANEKIQEAVKEAKKAVDD